MKTNEEKLRVETGKSAENPPGRKGPAYIELKSCSWYYDLSYVPATLRD